MQVAQPVKGINPRSIAWGRTLVRETAAGTNVNHTFPNKQLEISALVPASSEPRLIAIGLSDMDAESAAIADHLAKIQAIEQSMMQELLTGRMRSR